MSDASASDHEGDEYEALMTRITSEMDDAEARATGAFDELDAPEGRED
jgi:hypothetical protein